MRNVNLYTNRNYTKKEKQLLRSLLSLAKSKGDLKVRVTERELAQLELREEHMLMRFMQNHIILLDQEKTIYLQVITSIEKGTDDYQFTFLKDIIIGPYSHIIDIILSLSRKDAILLYQLLLQHHAHLLLGLEECKELFSCAGLYPRFYDFERYILSLIVDDFHEHTDCVLTYHKVKNEAYENAKITGIEFILEDKEIQPALQIDHVFYTRLSSPYILQNEIYAFIEKNHINALNEYFFSPDLFLHLLKIKKGVSLFVNPKLRISCDQKGNVKMEFIHIDK